MRVLRSVRLLVLLVVAASLYGQDLTVASFNVESGGADPVALRDDLRRIPSTDVWGFSETFAGPGPEPEPDFDTLLLQGIEAIEQQLEELKQMIRERPPQ